MAADCIALNDGSRILLNDGTSCILLNVQTGTDIVGTHAVPLVGPRPQQLIPVEFSFWLKSCLITKTGMRFCIKSPLLRQIESSIKIKSSLLREVTQSFKVKSTILVREKIKIFIQSTILTHESWKVMGVLANTKNKKLKKVLLRKLREFLDEDG